jgi:hypothetical protein
MKVRIALAGAFAAAIAAVAAPSAAYAGPNDNEGARIAGVGSVTAGACPYEHTCLYTRPNYTGRMFKLYHCNTYSMSQWNGVGSWHNNNSGGVWADLLDQQKELLVSVAAGTAWPTEDFEPVWYVKPC